jgi:ubiquinone/menaquinone biosynthesis C-methylase UbiE
LGRLIAFIMSRETWGENSRAIDALGIAASDHVIDIGCGHGRSLAALAARAGHGHVVGIDPSDLMAGIAAQRNRELIRARRVEVRIAAIDALPFPDAAFDKALCVHVVYFWENLDAAFREIARVLKPGGRLALVFRTNDDEAAVRAFPADVYRFPSLTDVSAALIRAGFAVDRTDRSGAGPMLMVAAKLRKDGA